MPFPSMISLDLVLVSVAMQAWVFGVHKFYFGYFMFAVLFCFPPKKPFDCC